MKLLVHISKNCTWVSQPSCRPKVHNPIGQPSAYPPVRAQLLHPSLSSPLSEYLGLRLKSIGRRSPISHHQSRLRVNITPKIVLIPAFMAALDKLLDPWNIRAKTTRLGTFTGTKTYSWDEPTTTTTMFFFLCHPRMRLLPLVLWTA